jgi:hypothetical protein
MLTPKISAFKLQEPVPDLASGNQMKGRLIADVIMNLPFPFRSLSAVQY